MYVQVDGGEKNKKKKNKGMLYVHETHVQVHIDIFVRIVQLLAPNDMKQKVNIVFGWVDFRGDGKYRKEN